MYLNPHLPEKLSRTALNYKFRGEKLVIGLDKGHYSVSTPRFKLSSTTDFGFNADKNELEFFNSNNDAYSLKARLINAGKLSLEIIKWDEKECVWNQVSSPNVGKISYSACKLKADSKYVIAVNGKISKTIKSDKEGRLEFDVNTKPDSEEIRIQLVNE
jgi:hypothetical protein